MAKPNIIVELESKTSVDDVLQLISLHANELLLAQAQDIIANHLHDGVYATYEQIEMLSSIINENDYGTLFPVVEEPII